MDGAHCRRWNISGSMFSLGPPFECREPHAFIIRIIEEVDRPPGHHCVAAVGIGRSVAWPKY